VHVFTKVRLSNSDASARNRPPKVIHSWRHTGSGRGPITKSTSKSDSRMTSYRKWAWSDRLPVKLKMFGHPRCSSSWNLRFLSGRQVGQKRGEKFRNPPRNVHMVKSKKAESMLDLILNSLTLGVCGVVEWETCRSRVWSDLDLLITTLTYLVWRRFWVSLCWNQFQLFVSYEMKLMECFTHDCVKHSIFFLVPQIVNRLCASISLKCRCTWVCDKAVKC